MCSTSQTRPLRVDLISSPPLPSPGRLGLYIAPGKQGLSLFGSAHARDLSPDLERLRALGTHSLVTLLEDHEMDLLHIHPLLREAQAWALEALHLPIRDVDVPTAAQQAQVKNLACAIRVRREDGRNVVVHCRGGLGRSGILAACVLTLYCLPVDSAIDVVRSARAGAIETYAQEQYVRTYATQTGAQDD